MTYEKFEQNLRDYPPTELYHTFCHLPVDKGEIGRKYFPEHYATWLYDMLRGYTIDMKKKMPPFTIEERERLKGALVDVANELRRVADTI